MIGFRRHWRLMSLLMVAITLSMGCSASTLAYYLLGEDEPKIEPGEMRLVAEKKGEEIKVVLLANAGMEMTPEFVTAERELSGLLSRHLVELSKENKQKVSVVPARKVQDFKNTHPNWQSMKLEEIGKLFKADYVVYLQIQSLSLYEQGSANQVYRGRAEIDISLVDMHHPDEDPIEKHYSGEYPSRGPIPVDDKNPRLFYLDFMNFLAKHLAWYFTPHEFKMDVDD